MQYPEEATMETLLLIIGIVAIALLLICPAPRPQIIYVPLEGRLPMSAAG
jgi:hypothetical protein